LDPQSGSYQEPSAETVRQYLVDGDLPIVKTVWVTSGWVVEWTTYAESTGANPVVRGPGDTVNALITVRAHARRPDAAATLYAAFEPANPAGVYPLPRLQVTPTRIGDASRTLLVASRASDDWGASSGGAALPGGQAGRATKAFGDAGMAKVFLGFDLRAADARSSTVSFALPLASDSVSSTGALDADPNGEEQRIAEAWRGRLHQVQVTLPDRDLQNALYTSFAYLLLARTETGVASGPTTEQATWVRDAAYITPALGVMGRSDAARLILDALARSQLPSGRQPPILESSGVTRLPLRDEWDAQGEYIFATVEQARLTRDAAYLRAVYPRLLRAAEYQRRLVQAARDARQWGSPFFGLLPAGESAEDLLDPTWHHYWDDFWALAGFDEAAWAADQLGQVDDASWLRSEAEQLRQNVQASAVMSQSYPGLPYFGNGPEDMTSTAMARSATPAVWPFLGLPSQSELVQHSFQIYEGWLIRPNGGGYQHYGGNYWPYAGLSLAHAFYRLGMADAAWQIVHWSLEHQTAPGLYAWGEAINPTRLDLVSGDSPHAWMAAEIVLFARDVLLREDDRRLDLGPFPSSWLAPGSTMAIHHAPTALGTFGYRLTVAADGTSLRLTFDGTGPPNGYRLTLPAGMSATSVTVDGKTRGASGPTIDLPSDARAAVIRVQRPDAAVAPRSGPR
jgi:hypothetical protein